MKYILASAFAVVFVLTAQGQKKSIHHVLTDHENKIEFKIDDKVVKVVDVPARNHYRKLYPFFVKSGREVYFLKEAEVPEVLKAFFLTVPKEEYMSLHPSMIEVSADVMQRDNFIVIADHLTLYASGVQGVRSMATVYDKDGTIVATLPENNDGYFAPVVTDDGEYLGTNYGDSGGEEETSLLPNPGFRIYDLKTKKYCMMFSQ